MADVGHTENVVLRFQPQDEISPFIQRVREEIQGIGSSLKEMDTYFAQMGSHGSELLSIFGGLAGKVSSTAGDLSIVNSEMESSIGKINGMKSGMSEFDAAVNSAESHSSALGSQISEAGTKAKAGIDQASKGLEGVSKEAGVAKTSVDKVGQAGETMGKDISNGAKTADAGLTSISNKSESVGSSLNNLGGAIGGIAGSMTLMAIGNLAWSGANQAQFNKAYLASKMGTKAANDYVKQIQDIVAIVPGDDTFMNALLSGALAKQTNLSHDELMMLASDSADYMGFSVNQLGKSSVETQQDLMQYISTGNTSQLTRDSILQDQVDKLKDQKTVSKRIAALDAAMVKDGYKGASSWGQTATKVQTVEGLFQKAATALGTHILPAVNWIADKITDWDTKTNGASSFWILAIAGAVALAAALGPVVWAVKQTWGAITGIGSGLKKLGGRHKVDIDCESDCPLVDEGINGGSGSGSSSKSGKGGKSSKGGKGGKGKSNSKNSGKLSKLREFLREDKGTIGSGGGNLDSILGKLGKFKGGSKGLLGKIARGGGTLLRAAGPLGLLMDAGFAAQGAWDGWNSTQGTKGDKAKGAVGGAVESFTMGLIPKDSVVKGINWVDKEFKTLKPKVSKDLKAIPTTAKKDLAKVGGIIASPFIQGFNTAKSTVFGGINYVKTTVGGGINGLTTAFWKLPGEIGGALKAMVDKIEDWTKQGIGWLKKLYCMVVGCSPGVIPAFKRMSDEVPSYLRKTTPHIKSFSKLINAPDLRVGNGSTGVGSNGNVEYHQHYHTNTFDMSHIDKHELASALIEIYEGSSTENTKPTGGSSTPTSS